MKIRLLTLFLCLTLFIAITPFVFAEEAQGTNIVSTSTTYFEDGSYCITTITEYPSVFNTRTAEQQKTGTKMYACFDSSGSQLFSLTVHGTFTYNGTAAKATAASYSYTVDSALWGFSSGSASCSGATAAATADFKLLGFLSTKTLDASLSCSPIGTLS